MEKKGKVYLIGAGPGDPELMTIKGIKLLQECDVLIYDRLASPSLLTYTKQDCEKVYVGKAAGHHSMKQEEINKILVEKACSSSLVVRLKGGDPFVFGRGGEEVLELSEHGIEYEVVPGITSAIAAATYAGIPITHRGASQSFHVITGHTAEEVATLPQELTTLAKCKGTLVVLMGLGNMEMLCQQLMEYGKAEDTPVAVIENATTIWQREVRGTLADITAKTVKAKIKSPAIIIIGEVAGLDLRTAVRKRLSGAKIGITGTKVITDKLKELLSGLNAGVEVICFSKREEYHEDTTFTKALNSLKDYTWILLTSTNSVEVLFRKIKEMKLDYRRLSHIQFAVVGKGTEQALLRQGFQADFVPKEYTVSRMASEMCAFLGEGDRLLIPRAKQGSEELVAILTQNHIAFDDIKIYDIQTEYVSPRDGRSNESGYDYITFASSSGVHGFFQQENTFNGLTNKTKYVCIGEITRDTLQQYGIEGALMAKEANVQGVVTAICEDYNGHGE